MQDYWISAEPEEYGIHISPASSAGSGTLTVRGCAFVDGVRGIDVDGYGAKEVKVLGENRFSNTLIAVRSYSGYTENFQCHDNYFYNCVVDVGSNCPNSSIQANKIKKTTACNFTDPSALYSIWLALTSDTSAIINGNMFEVDLDTAQMFVYMIFIGGNNASCVGNTMVVNSTVDSTLAAIHCTGNDNTMTGNTITFDFPSDSSPNNHKGINI